MLQEQRIDVRRIDEEMRAEKIADRRLRELGHVVRQLLLRVAPYEVGIGLREAELREVVHDLGAGKRLGEKDDIGVD
jgi:hypothetical protein